MNSYAQTIRRARSTPVSDWRLIATVLLAASLVLFAWWVVLTPGGETPLLWFDDVGVAVAAFAAGVFSLVAARHYAGSKTGVAWVLVACGMFLYAFGDGSWAYQELGLGGEVPFPSVSDIGYLGSYVPIFIGLLLMPAAPASGSRRARLALDVLIATAALFILSWQLVLAPMLAEADGSLLETVVSLAYPVGDLIVVLAVFVLIARARPGSSRLFLFLLAGAFAVTALSDTLYTYLQENGLYDTGSYIDIGWFAGYTLVSLAAVVSTGSRLRSDQRSAEEEKGASFWQSAALYSAIVPLGVLELAGEPEFLAAGVVFVIALLSARQMLAVRENIYLNKQLRALTAELEIRVKERTMQLLRQRGAQDDIPA